MGFEQVPESASSQKSTVCSSKCFGLVKYVCLVAEMLGYSWENEHLRLKEKAWGSPVKEPWQEQAAGQDCYRSTARENTRGWPQLQRCSVASREGDNA